MTKTSFLSRYDQGRFGWIAEYRAAIVVAFDFGIVAQHANTQG